MIFQALTLILHSLFFLFLLSLSSQSLQNQSQFFVIMQQSLSGDSLKNWKPDGKGLPAENYYCHFAGVSCNGQGSVVEIDISGWSLSGRIPSNICAYLPELRKFRLSNNTFSGGFPVGILNCSHLEELVMNSVNFAGTLPDFSPLTSLKVLDMSENLFSGEFPASVMNLSELEVLNLNESPGFNQWVLPAKFLRLTKLRQLILSTCSIVGQIPAFLANMTVLEDLELSGNYLVGEIPVELGKLTNLIQLELYYNMLTGNIPREIGNLTRLVDIDISVNKLTGNIPESVFALPELRAFHCYNNSLTGKIPDVIGNSTSLAELSLYGNFLTGGLPQNLGKFSDFILLDVAENNLTGKLPSEICRGGKLAYFLVLQNQFSGELPESYGKCESLLRFRVSLNRLSGKIPQGLLGLPHVSIIDTSFNFFEGSIAKSIGKAKNLSEMYMQNNWFSGSIPPEIAGANKLVKLDLSNNYLIGPIPNEIGDLKRLNLLLLQRNNLSSSIPESLSSLKFLNVLNLSNNLLTGKISESLCVLLPNSLDFSNNRLSGPVPLTLIQEGLADSLSGNPGLCISVNLNSSNPFLPLCSQSNKKNIFNRNWVFGLLAIAVILGIFLFLKRRFDRKRVVMEVETSSSSSLFSWDKKSFHKLSFDHQEILESLDDKNIVGHGGSGTVYKIQLNNGQSVAVKKLWTRITKNPSPDQWYFDREIETEIETLGSIRHKNIVKLYCCFSNLGLNFLVYEYMPNGNLWDALHKGIIFLDWPTRHRIALGIAQGLSYLHHDLLPPIIHRDIKSMNILLDADFQPKVADFGVAKVLQARGSKDSSTTAIAGTYGYLAPVRIFIQGNHKMRCLQLWVVLMELITGKKPVEAEFGESKSIIFWISRKIESKEGVMEVLDKRLSGSFKTEMILMLRIAIRCTLSTPADRPTMNEIVQMLIETFPCEIASSISSNKVKEPTTIKSNTNPTSP